MAGTPEKPVVPKALRRIAWIAVIGGLSGAIFLRFAQREPVGQALIDTAIPLSAILLLAGLVLLVERVFSGRARLWARIAELSVALGAIVFGFGRGSTATLILAGAFWLFVTGALIVLTALRPEVTT